MITPYMPPEMMGMPPARLLWPDQFRTQESHDVRYYLGTNTMSVVVPPEPPPPPPAPDWPLSLISADFHGNVTYKVPALDPALFAKPDSIIVAFVPGTVAPTTPDAALAAAGAMTVTTTFPASFGAIGLDQNVPVLVPGPFAPGPYVVVVIGRFEDPTAGTPT